MLRLINKFKIRTSIYIEESIILFFKVVSVDHTTIKTTLKSVDKKSITMNLKSVNERERKIRYKLQYQTNYNNINNTAITNNNNNNPHLMNSYVQMGNRTTPPKQSNLYSEFNENYSESTKTNSDKNSKHKTKGVPIRKNRQYTPIPKSHSIIASNDNNGGRDLETPKFYDQKRRNKSFGGNNNVDGNVNVSADEQINMNINDVIKHIDEGKKLHSFVPPTDTQNIFFNTSEIIHRKFFEYVFEEFLGKIFIYEKDNDDLIKLDSLYKYFVYLRGLKNILFIEKNRIYFSSVFFVDDEIEGY